ncbi:MAG TPA: DUF1566 domain-containing protein [bacterium]|nr:DUF1566 domain-containing protein [bacterium]
MCRFNALPPQTTLILAMLMLALSGCNNGKTSSDNEQVPDDGATDNTVTDETTDDALPDMTDQSDQTNDDSAAVTGDDIVETDDDPMVDDDSAVVADDSLLLDEDATDDLLTDDGFSVDEDVVTMAVLCTGQTKCYDGSAEMICPAEGNAFYGQDAQYAALGKCAPRNYTVSGSDGSDIVTDEMTGLIWQRTLTGSTYQWQGAIDHCADLTYGGYDDWRLPTRKELATLPDYGRYDPAINTAVFPDTSTGLFWSSSPYVSLVSEAWSVSFSSGMVTDFSKEVASHARCVRGEVLSGSVFAEATVAGKVIVIDTFTGLIWTKEYSAPLTWQNALNYCESLDYGGSADWRLPNIEESRSLIDDTLKLPASSFPGMPVAQTFWSSSSNVNLTGHAWVVSSGDGNMSISPKSSTTYARCVR